MYVVRLTNESDAMVLSNLSEIVPNFGRFCFQKL